MLANNVSYFSELENASVKHLQVKASRYSRLAKDITDAINEAVANEKYSCTVTLPETGDSRQKYSSLEFELLIKELERLGYEVKTAPTEVTVSWFYPKNGSLVEDGNGWAATLKEHG